MNFFHGNLQYLIKKGKVKKEDLYKYCNLSPLDLSLILDHSNEPGIDGLLKISTQVNIPLDILLKTDLKRLESLKNRNIKLLIIDVDGVMTDGGMYYSETGDEHKKFNTKDGMAIKSLTKKGFPVGIISSGFNISLIQRRADLLGIQHVYVGIEEKTKILEQWCEQLGITLKNVAYIGDDINDENTMKQTGYCACPADAVHRIKMVSNLILSKKGGDGCVREFIEVLFGQVESV